MSQGRLFNEAEWGQLPIVEKLRKTGLGQDYWRDIRAVAEHIAPLLAWRPPGLEEMTDHDMRHSYRIVANVCSVLPGAAQLNETEIAVLLYSSLYHDAGMWTTARQVSEALGNDDFVGFSEQTNAALLARARHLLDEGTPEARSAATMLLRQLVAEWSRSRHAARSAEVLTLATDGASLVPQRVLPEVLQCVALVAEAHAWTIDKLLADPSLARRRVMRTGNAEADWVNLRYVASLLRLGDLLDLDEGRVTSLLLKYLGELSPSAAPHWHKARRLRFTDLTPDCIGIAGDFDYDQDGPVAAEAYQLARQWIGYIRQETDALRRMCTQPRRHQIDERAAVGALVIDDSAVKASGLVFSQELYFSLDRDRIIELLGDEIYQDRTVFIRELLQNAIDATRLQMVRDYLGLNGAQRKAKFGTARLDLRTPMSWPSSVTAVDDYVISVTITDSPSDTEPIQSDERSGVFEVQDRGIGMTPEQMQSYFLQIGSSYYRSREFTESYHHQSISRFGIGFLSCLLAAERVEVVSRPLHAAEGVRLIAQSDSRVCSAGRAPDAAYGTTVKLWVRPEVVRQCDEAQHRDHYPAAEITGHVDDDSCLANQVRSWVPWSEMRILINGRPWGPRSPLTLAASPETYQWPLEIVSEEEHLLAHAVVTTEIHISGLPLVTSTPAQSTWPAIAGIMLPPWDVYGFTPPSPRLVLNAYMASDRAIGPSRSQREPFPPALARAEILRSWQEAVEQCLVASPPWLSLWRIYLQRTQLVPRRTVLPVRRGDEVSWEEWDSARVHNEACVLVPFFAVFSGSLRAPVPCIGVPDGFPHLLGVVMSDALSVRLRAFFPNNPGFVRLSDGVVGATFYGDRFDADDLLRDPYVFFIGSVFRRDPETGVWTPSQGTDTTLAAERIPEVGSEAEVWQRLSFNPDRADSWVEAHKRFGPAPRIVVPEDAMRVSVAESVWLGLAGEPE